MTNKLKIKLRGDYRYINALLILIDETETLNYQFSKYGLEPMQTIDIEYAEENNETGEINLKTVD